MLVIGNFFCIDNIKHISWFLFRFSAVIVSMVDCIEALSTVQFFYFPSRVSNTDQGKLCFYLVHTL